LACESGEALEVGFQAGFGVFFGVIEDSDRAGVAGLLDGF
jgi:hypothetical protein